MLSKTRFRLRFRGLQYLGLSLKCCLRLGLDCDTLVFNVLVLVLSAVQDSAWIVLHWLLLNVLVLVLSTILTDTFEIQKHFLILSQYDL